MPSESIANHNVHDSTCMQFGQRASNVLISGESCSWFILPNYVYPRRIEIKLHYGMYDKWVMNVGLFVGASGKTSSGQCKRRP